MCGILGYVGNGNASDFLIEGLRRLEYRGYDSAGIAVYEMGKSRLRKSGTSGKFGKGAGVPSFTWKYRYRAYPMGNSRQTIRCECPSPWG